MDEPQIHGYAVPNYSDTSNFEHTGWVDLGKYESLREVFDALAVQNIMAGTSSYTFSPRYGMTRGDFLTIIMKLYGLSGWELETEPFCDVSEDSSCFDAVMTARSAGIVYGSGNNNFSPNIYISGAEAQTVISRTLDYVGQENLLFDFSEGDFSYMLTPYTIRADIAKALYALHSTMSTPIISETSVLLDGKIMDWSMLKIDGSNYVPLEVLRQTFPQLETISISNTTYDHQPNQSGHLPIPMEHTNRVFLSDILLQNGETFANAPSFMYRGTQYIQLGSVAELLNIDVQWNEKAAVIVLEQSIQ